MPEYRYIMKRHSDRSRLANQANTEAKNWFTQNPPSGEHVDPRKFLVIYKAANDCWWAAINAFPYLVDDRALGRGIYVVSFCDTAEGYLEYLARAAQQRPDPDPLVVFAGSIRDDKEDDGGIDYAL